MIRGWVYVLSNRAMPDIVKIGYSTKDPSLRADELGGTGLPHPFVVEYDVLISEPRDVEQQVHKQLQDHHEGKEFFRISVIQAIECIRKIASIQKKNILLETLNESVNLTANFGPIRVIFCPTCRAKNASSSLKCKNCNSPLR